MRRIFQIFLLVISLLFVIGCNLSEEEIEKVAYESLTIHEKGDLINKKGVVKRLKSLPEDLNKDNIYSVTFKSKYNHEKFVVYVDGKKGKVIGGIMRK